MSTGLQMFCLRLRQEIFIYVNDSTSHLVTTFAVFFKFLMTIFFSTVLSLLQMNTI